MNPITNMKNLQKINDRELEMGIAGTKSSWHWEYKDSAWVYVGGLPYDLTGIFLGLLAELDQISGFLFLRG